MIFIKNSLIARILKVEAIVLFPLVLFAAKEPEETLINHELIHVKQIKRDGFFYFYFRYIKEYLQHRLMKKSHYEAYRLISYEREAYDNQVENKKSQV